MIAITVKDVTKSFRTLFSRKIVLKNVNFEVQEGEVFGLIGPNGAGKTTLMGCLLGLLRIDSGIIYIEGRSPCDTKIKKDIGYLPEKPNFYTGMTGKEFLLFMGGLYGSKGTKLKERIEFLLEELRLKDYADKKIKVYSRGILQRLGIAQALLHNPKILFLDEPTSGMDPAGIMLVRKKILEFKKEGGTVFINSHQLSEVEKVCDRIAFIENGIIKSIDNVHDEFIIRIEYEPLNEIALLSKIQLFRAIKILAISETMVEVEISNSILLSSFLKFLLENGVIIRQVISTRNLERYFNK